MSMPNTGYVPGASSSGAAVHAVAAGDAPSSFDTGTKVMAERDGVFAPGKIDADGPPYDLPRRWKVKFDADGEVRFLRPGDIKHMTDEDLEAERLRVATLYYRVEEFCKYAKKDSNLPCKVTYYCTHAPTTHQPSEPICGHSLHASSLPQRYWTLYVSHSLSSLRFPSLTSTDVIGIGVFFLLLTIAGAVFLPMGFNQGAGVFARHDPAVEFTSVAGGATIRAVAHKAASRSSENGAVCVDVYTYTFSKTADLNKTLLKNYTSAAIEMAQREGGGCDGASKQVPATFKAGQNVPCWQPTAVARDSTIGFTDSLATFYNCGNLEVSPWGENQWGGMGCVRVGRGVRSTRNIWCCVALCLIPALVNV